jgi:hypothetical protein
MRPLLEMVERREREPELVGQHGLIPEDYPGRFRLDGEQARVEGPVVAVGKSLIFNI